MEVDGGVEVGQEGGRREEWRRREGWDRGLGKRRGGADDGEVWQRVKGSSRGVGVERKGKAEDGGSGGGWVGHSKGCMER